MPDTDSGPDTPAADRSTPVAPLARRVEVDISSPDLWEAVADRIGNHPYTYDLGDDSHRMDVVQIVLTALRDHIGESPA